MFLYGLFLGLVPLILPTYLPPLTFAAPIDAIPAPQPGSIFDSASPSDQSIHYGISYELLDTFKLVSQYAAASYCADNNDSPNTPLTCQTHNCPLVEATNATALSEFENTPKFDDTGYVAIDDMNQLIVLAIRGSVSKKNWQADWDLIRTDTKFCHDCHIHRGFQHSWGEMKDAVITSMKEAVKQRPDYRIIVTGHSLGGAIAIIAAAELRQVDDHFLAVTELYTFGSPRIANKEGAAWLSRQSRYSWRITYDDDIVPRLPPRAIGYHHTEPEYWIGHGVGDYPAPEQFEWANREDSSWGNEGQVTPSKAAHSHYFGLISSCKGDSHDRVDFVPDGPLPADNATLGEWQAWAQSGLDH
ncbi:MAG: hypothetical protein Q9222_003791 [Ikaeria aurantiellina]